MPGQIRISLEYRRHVGPRFVHGAVELNFDALGPPGFFSRAAWPRGDDYEAAVREEVEQALRERLGDSTPVRVTLESITFDDVSSCEVGFRKAARAATLAAFEC